MTSKCGFAVIALTAMLSLAGITVSLVNNGPGSNCNMGIRANVLLISICNIAIYVFCLYTRRKNYTTSLLEHPHSKLFALIVVIPMIVWACIIAAITSDCKTALIASYPNLIIMVYSEIASYSLLVLYILYNSIDFNKYKYMYYHSQVNRKISKVEIACYEYDESCREVTAKMKNYRETFNRGPSVGYDTEHQMLMYAFTRDIARTVLTTVSRKAKRSQLVLSLMQSTHMMHEIEHSIAKERCELARTYMEKCIAVHTSNPTEANRLSMVNARMQFDQHNRTCVERANDLVTSSDKTIHAVQRSIIDTRAYTMSLEMPERDLIENVTLVP